MHDPREGVTPLGTIQTGASRSRVPAVFEPVLEAAIDLVRAADGDSSLYVYGSVATGMAKPRVSDVDLLSVGISLAAAGDIARALSGSFSDLCRAVEVAAAQHPDFLGDSDEAHGGRVFLKHYCVHLGGPDLHSSRPDSLPDRQAARGFNGDIAQHNSRWRMELDAGCDPAELSRRMARKSLLAVAGLVSVHDETWTTDREAAAARWAEIEPTLASDLRMLVNWSRAGEPDRETVAAALDGVIATVTESFAKTIGLWAY